MTYISRCEHGTPMALCCKCFPDVSEQPDWSKYRHTHPVKELTDKEIYACFHQYFVLGEPKPTHYELEYEDLIDFARAILRKAQEK